MITQRRIFQAKPERAAALVEKLMELLPSFQVGDRVRARVYTGMIRGQVDQVVLERDVESAGHLVAERVLRAPSQADADSYWRQRVAPLIDGETVELWHWEEAAR